ncbi:MAG: hypothetical protein Q4G46_12155, partial [Propionibacteriaceae bacterium]|nr:hypothetical protein [Propionibacteriaceae bacterium]
MAGFPLALTTRLSGEPRNRRVARRWKAALNRDLRPVSVLLAMLITRLLIAWKWVQIEELGLGDVLYYWSRTAEMATVPLAETMREYPTPAVWFLSVPQWLEQRASRGDSYW